MTPKPIRCALYIRVSTSDQRYLQQFRELRRAVELRGWKVAAVYRERRSAAPGKDRPQWSRLRKDASQRRFGAVAAASLDRLGRSSLDILNAVEEFRARGVRLYLQREGIATDDPSGQLLITVLAGVAQLERDLISERTRQGMRAAARRGAKVGRPRIDSITSADLDRVIDGWTTCVELARQHATSTMTVRRRVQERRAKRSDDEASRIAFQLSTPAADHDAFDRPSLIDRLVGAELAQHVRQQLKKAPRKRALKPPRKTAPKPAPQKRT